MRTRASAAVEGSDWPYTVNALWLRPSDMHGSDPARSKVLIAKMVFRPIGRCIWPAAGRVADSRRDRQIPHLIAQGSTSTEIARTTECSDGHLRRITANLTTRIGATNRARAAALTTRWGLN